MPESNACNSIRPDPEHRDRCRLNDIAAVDYLEDSRALASQDWNLCDDFPRVIVICIVRLAVLFAPLKDGPWHGVPVVVCTMVEATTYLIFVCLLQSRPLLSFLMREPPLGKVRQSRTRPDRHLLHESGGRKLRNSACKIGLQKIEKRESDDNAALRPDQTDAIITHEFTVAYSRDIIGRNQANLYEDGVTARPNEQV
ncbi:MAG: hypothetical protein Q9160_007291 [Pyrenula sp. 1 TL-2023]